MRNFHLCHHNPCNPLTTFQFLLLTYFNTIEIEDTIKNLKVKKSSGGLDNFTTVLVKLAAEAVSNPLCLIFTKYIQEDVFPNILKVGKVIPVFKSGVSQDLNNYRPISLLSVFSKVLEK